MENLNELIDNIANDGHPSIRFCKDIEGKLEDIPINLSEGSEDTPFTRGETVVMELILSAHERFLALNRMHPMEIQEWVFAIHQLQSILSHRCLKRLYPNYFI